MAYDSTLPDSQNQVRFLIGDTAATQLLQDAEIDWVLGEQSNVYLAAARCLEILRGKWASAGKGLAEKQVDELRIRWGSGADNFKTLESYINHLRMLGTPSPVPVRAPRVNA